MIRIIGTLMSLKIKDSFFFFRIEAEETCAGIREIIFTRLSPSK